MKTIRNSDFARFMAITLATFVSLGTFMVPRPAQAQTLEQALRNSLNVIPVAAVVSADDTDSAIIIRYIGTGTANSGTVDVEVDTDIVFLQGVQGAEAASTELECPVSGALGGIIDVDDAACDTVGEVVDIINDSTSWRAVVVDALRSDVVNDRILDEAATRATSVNGYAIKWDTSTALMSTRALVTPDLRTMAGYLRAGQSLGTVNDIESDVFDNTQTVFRLANATATTGGALTFTIFSVDVGKFEGNANTFTETVTTLYAEPGGATGANKVFDDQAPFGIRSRPNEKMLVRLSSTVSTSAHVLRAYGEMIRQ